MLKVKEMPGHPICDNFLELPGSLAGFLHAALYIDNAFHILTSMTRRTCECRLRTSLIVPCNR